MQLETNEAGLEQRLSSLQTQIEHLRQTSPSDPRALEQRLATLTEFGAEILRRWSATADRHGAAVSQFEAHLRELSDAGTHMQQDAAQRLRDLERIIQQEWDALRQLHDAPVKQLVEQAASLTEVCIATANSAQQGFDRAEARLAAIETDFHRSASELTREIQNVLAELRNRPPAAARQLPGETPSWPLDDVTRLHSQLRETDGSPSLAGVLALPEASAPVAPDTAVETEHVPSAGEPPQRGQLARAALIAVAVLVVVAGGFVWRLERDVRASAERIDESQRQARLAADAATRQVAERQEQAARELAAAHELAARAQMIGDVLAAPDLVRYSLVGRDAVASAFGQVLWSRSRGFVFSASGLPPPPQDATYQIWLLTRTGAVSAGTFVPDSNGRVTLAATPKVPPSLLGAIVTLERQGGGDTPSGEPLLARMPLPPPAS